MRSEGAHVIMDARSCRAISVSSMIDVLRDLTPLNRLPCASGYEVAIERARAVLPFRVVEYPPDDIHNGWVIPPKSDVTRATIEKDGQLVWDGLSHPLAVIAYSAPFRGRVSLEELKRHLHFDARFDDALPFHFRQMYRSWARDWGFCVPKRLYESLDDGAYDVTIETRESASPLRILEHVHPGKLDTTIVIGGNFDHPGVANDGVAGCVVGMELFRRLRGRQTRLTYVLALVPGIIGSEYYLARMPAAHRAHLLEGVFLEMLGTSTELAFQRSKGGDSGLDALVPAALSASGARHRVAAYADVIVNDEYIWEAFGIPMSSLSRFPYPEYHSSRDDMSIIRERSLEEAVDVLLRAIDTLESTPLVRKTFEGTICLSNPRYDLYVDPGQPAFGDAPDEQRRRLRRLMDELPTLRRPKSVAAIAASAGLDTATALAYLEKCSERGVVVLE